MFIEVAGAGCRPLPTVQCGRFCSFSPCIEQVQRTCSALQEHGFEELTTMEVLQTELKVTRRTVPVRDLSFLRHKSSEKPVEEKPSGDTTFVVAAWPTSSPGHTGYLTVATLPPMFARSNKKGAKSEISVEKNETGNGEKMAIDEANND
ncbi:tRNA (adenine(58)-N(1))-methyltransferase catalytic subunit TRMT61A-like [Ostrinia furnacalis]|uniref:tRNA (adenine(58)-N(1))-methyltransferase catalytic subunit TRMT61A-like n=1 Tax=Ostrinia furnacalis TaxID=93504 RepID=UPI00103B658F|nr:tRNA (adenine(58)-N(1))-methyltransferase catalytic subunit TRMT61A-like [Ostrinia furnacalis]